MIAGSLVATVQPAVGFAWCSSPPISTYLDLNTRLYLVRSLLFRRASQNVVSPGTRPEAPARLILMAHYDAARTGYIFSKASKRIRRLPERTRVGLGPFRLFFWLGLAPLLPILGARMAGLDATWLNALQAIPTIVLIVAAFLLIDIALSEIVPGAYDNASGVAAVLSAAEELTAEPPPNLDVWVVLAGSEESFCEGSRAFVRSRRKELDRDATYFVNVDSVSYGQVAYEVSQGPVISRPASTPQLVELCEALSAPAERDRSGATTDPPPAPRRRAAGAGRRTARDHPPHHRREREPAPPGTTPTTMSRIGSTPRRSPAQPSSSSALARLIDRDAGRRSGATSTAPPPAAAGRV